MTCLNSDKLEEEYGSRFMASTQRHLWEFLERLESLLPRPRIDQLLAAERSVGSLSPAEQSLLSILVNNPYTSIPDLLLTLMQRIRQRRSQDPSGEYINDFLFDCPCSTCRS
ncbi:hypothetical protein scyTo_0016976 [Scyliorhinus torazame]|uniref:TERF1-interacting nuclear factor 2 N-terminal domain-containing protein n=1 Tax=Scyliorhinus torazame TaxID=75743 RepID=A0A401Q2A1_SCYTO|nr:hypothetical protein [Scyliorhinus torazame]